MWLRDHEFLIIHYIISSILTTEQESQVALRYVVKMCSASKFEANVRKRKADVARCIGIGGPTPAKRRLAMKSKKIP